MGCCATVEDSTENARARQQFLLQANAANDRLHFLQHHHPEAFAAVDQMNSENNNNSNNNNTNNSHQMVHNAQAAAYAVASAPLFYASSPSAASSSSSQQQKELEISPNQHQHQRHQQQEYRPNPLVKIQPLSVDKLTTMSAIEKLEKHNVLPNFDEYKESMNNIALNSRWVVNSRLQRYTSALASAWPASTCNEHLLRDFVGESARMIIVKAKRVSLEKSTTILDETTNVCYFEVMHRDLLKYLFENPVSPEYQHHKKNSENNNNNNNNYFSNLSNNTINKNPYSSSIFSRAYVIATQVLACFATSSETRALLKQVAFRVSEKESLGEDACYHHAINTIVTVAGNVVQHRYESQFSSSTTVKKINSSVFGVAGSSNTKSMNFSPSNKNDPMMNMGGTTTSNSGNSDEQQPTLSQAASMSISVACFDDINLAHTHVMECFFDFLDEYKLEVLHSAVLEPCRLVFATAHDRSNLPPFAPEFKTKPEFDKDIRVSAINYYLTLLEGATGFALPISSATKYVGDVPTSCFLNFWNRLSDVHWKVFSKPKNLGKPIESLISEMKDSFGKGNLKSAQSDSQEPSMIHPSIMFFRDRVSNDSQLRTEFKLLVSRFTHFFSYEFFVPMFLNTLNSERKAQWKGFRKAIHCLFGEFQRRGLDQQFAPKASISANLMKKNPLENFLVSSPSVSGVFVPPPVPKQQQHENENVSSSLSTAPNMPNVPTSEYSQDASTTTTSASSSPPRKVATETEIEENITTQIEHEHEREINDKEWIDEDDFFFDDNFFTFMNLDRVVCFFSWLEILRPPPNRKQTLGRVGGAAFVSRTSGTPSPSVAYSEAQKSAKNFPSTTSNPAAFDWPAENEHFPTIFDEDFISEQLESTKRTNNNASSIFDLKSNQQQTVSGVSSSSTTNNSTNTNANAAAASSARRSTTKNNIHVSQNTDYEFAYDTTQDFNLAALNSCQAFEAEIDECPLCFEQRDDIEVLDHLGTDLGDVSQHKCCADCRDQYLTSGKCPFCRADVNTFDLVSDISSNFAQIFMKIASTNTYGNNSNNKNNNQTDAEYFKSDYFTSVTNVFESWQVIELDNSTDRRVLERISYYLLKDPRVGSTILSASAQALPWLRLICGIIFRLHSLVVEADNDAKNSDDNNNNNFVRPTAASAASASSRQQSSNKKKQRVSILSQLEGSVKGSLQSAVEAILFPFEYCGHENAPIFSSLPDWPITINQALSMLLSAKNAGLPLTSLSHLCNRLLRAMNTAFLFANVAVQPKVQMIMKKQLISSYLDGCQAYVDSMSEFRRTFQV